MKLLTCTLLFLVLLVGPAFSQASCLDPDELVQLDGQWEKALHASDAAFIQSLLAEDFIWIHNHTSTIDTKEKLVKRAADASVRATGNTRSRTSSGIEVRILGATGVVTGFTIVDRGPAPTRYAFMRTYVEIDGRCVLLANQTMAIPENEE